MKSLNLGCTPSYPKCPIACQQFTNNSLSIHSLAWSAKEKVASVAGKNNYIMKVNKENNWIADISTSAWFSFNVSLLMLKDRVNIYAG